MHFTCSNAAVSAHQKYRSQHICIHFNAVITWMWDPLNVSNLANLIAAALLCDNGRMNEVEGVINDFDKLLNADNKEMNATVTTAIEPREKDVTAIKKALADFCAAGVKINLKFEINPEIMGGMVVDIGNKSIDLSAVKTYTELQRLVSAPVQ